MEKNQIKSRSNDGKKTVNNFSNSCSSSRRMEKIRSGQAFLYREGGFQSMVVDLRMKEDICGKSQDG